MKKITLAALIFVATIAHTANAEEIKPQEKVLFEKCVHEKGEYGRSGHWAIITTVTGIDWIDKELNNFLFKDKTESQIKKEMEDDYKSTIEFYSDKEFGGKGFTIPKDCGEPIELSQELSVTFHEKKGNTLIFIKTESGNASHVGGNGSWGKWEEMIIDLKTRKKKIRKSQPEG
ncbi:MAG: hypothetical protein IJV35_06335 [Neisseriaceae bacterium]|nr:hypothetical protein [Neisseriaceae bacterium]